MNNILKFKINIRTTISFFSDIFFSTCFEPFKLNMIMLQVSYYEWIEQVYKTLVHRISHNLLKCFICIPLLLLWKTARCLSKTWFFRSSFHCPFMNGGKFTLSKAMHEERPFHRSDWIHKSAKKEQYFCFIGT